jgi:hypothetical protein
MPRIHKTILPRFKKALAERGVLRTAWACLCGPWYLIAEYRKARREFEHPVAPDDFDLRYGVETSTRVHGTDLKINSPNWVYSAGYWPTSTEITNEALSALPIPYEDFVFVDFGSGKGRVLLQASHFPFRRIIGVEFSFELHDIAESNLRRYKSDRQKCREIQSVCMDFTQFEIPREPLVAFLYNPSSETIMTALANRIAQALIENPRELWVIYVTPTYSVFEGGRPLDLHKLKASEKYAIFSNTTKRLAA